MSAEGIIDANGNLDGFKKEEETGDDTSFDCDTSAVSFRCAAPINQSVQEYATCVTVNASKVPIVLEMPTFVECEQSAETNDTSAVSFRCAAPINQSVKEYATCVTKVPIVLERPKNVACEQSASTDDTSAVHFRRAPLILQSKSAQRVAISRRATPTEPLKEYAECVTDCAPKVPIVLEKPTDVDHGQSAPECDTSAVHFRRAPLICQSRSAQRAAVSRRDAPAEMEKCLGSHAPPAQLTPAENELDSLIRELTTDTKEVDNEPQLAMADASQMITRVEVTYTPERISKEVLDSERQSFKTLCDLPTELLEWNSLIASLQNVYKFFVHEYAVISKESLAQIIPAYWCRVFKNLLKDTWTVVDVDFDSLLRSNDESWMRYIVDPVLDNISPPERLMLVTFMGLSIVTNVTDLGYGQMQQCVNDDLLYSIFKYVFPHVQCFDSEKNNARRLRSLCLSIVYNCARNPANRSSYRSSSFLDGIQSLNVENFFRTKREWVTRAREGNSIYVLLMNIFDVTKLALTKTEYEEDVDMQYMRKVQMNAVLSLAYLFEEGVDAMQLSATDEIIIYLQKRTSAALVSPNFIDSTFSLEELLNGLEKLAVNEDNQERMVMHGALVLMFDVLDYLGLPNAACAAALKVLWQLSFNHASKIKESKKLLDVIRELKHHSNDDIRKSAEGVMWELEDRVNSEQKKSTSGPQKHIMLSYCWAQQESVKKVASLLKKSGFNLWLDIDRMTRSTIDAMAEAVENADIFLMFMSKNYKESAACQSEAKYARVRKVEIIPIMLENQWRADGWLGFILGDLLYFKFPQDDEKAFSNKYHELFTEISRFYEKKGFAIPAVENVEISSVDAPSREAKEKKPQKPGRKPCSPVRIKPKEDNPVEQGTNTLDLDLPKTPSGNSPNTWNEQKVCDWLAQNSIDRSKFCSDLTVDGELLKFLFKLQDQHPILFYKFLEKDLGLKSLEGVSKFVIGLDNLCAD